MRTGERKLEVPRGEIPPRLTFLYSYADLMSLEPRPLFSERRAMEKMGPIRLGLHLISRTIYFKGCESIRGKRRYGFPQRAWLWLWRQERKMWPK